MSIKHTSELIKSNIATILTEFPNAYIRPCNKSEFPKKPRNMTQEQWDALDASDKSLFVPAPSHRRKDHLYAHICITPFTYGEKGFKHFSTESFYYVTSSTTRIDTIPFISFREDLINAWKDKGKFPNVIWFVKNENLYKIIDGKDLERHYIQAITEKNLKRYYVDEHSYLAFFVCNKSEMKEKATSIPENTTFDPKYLSTFDYIENVTYKKYRNYKGTVYGILRYKDTNGKIIIKKQMFSSIREAYYTNFDKFDCSYKTVVRNTNAGALQKMLPLYEDMQLLFTYDKNDFENPEAAFSKCISKKETKVEFGEETIITTKEVAKSPSQIIAKEELKALDVVLDEDDFCPEETDSLDSDIDDKPEQDEPSGIEREDFLKEWRRMKEELHKKLSVESTRHYEQIDALF